MNATVGEVRIPLRDTELYWDALEFANTKDPFYQKKYEKELKFLKAAYASLSAIPELDRRAINTIKTWIDEIEQKRNLIQKIVFMLLDYVMRRIPGN